MGIFVFDVVKAFSDAITASFSAVSNNITTVSSNVTDLAENTSTDVANLQNFTISTQTAGSRKPAWISPRPISDVVYPDSQNLYTFSTGNTLGASAGTAHTHGTFNSVFSGNATLLCGQNESLGSYVTITDPNIFDTIGVYWGKNSGTLNQCYLEVFAENPDTSIYRISSTEISASLGTLAYAEVALNTPRIVQPGERYVVRLRNSSSTVGTAMLVGLSTATISPKMMFFTSGSSLTAQTSYTAAEVATANAGTFNVAWAMLANTSPAASDVSYSDDFNRSQFGGLWLLSSTWATQLGITSSMATYQGTTNGDQHALFIRPTNNDGNRVDFDVSNTVLATTHARCGGFMHADQGLTQMVYLGVTDNAVNIYSGASGSLTSRATVSSTDNDGTWSLIYDVPSNTYTAYKSGIAVGLSWTDGGAAVSHAAGYNFGGVRVSRVSSVNAGTLDNWTLRDYA